MFTGSIIWRGIVYAVMMTAAKASVGVVLYCDHCNRTWLRKKNSPPARRLEDIENARSAPHSQAIMIAFAMVARGEIGFLIASLSQSSGTLTLQQNGVTVESSTGEDVFLVIVWAVMLCTIIGPVMVGIIIRRYARANFPS
jgi:Kef-type K+ transport system membrane component KefB